MKKMMWLVVAMCLMVSMLAFAGDEKKADKKAKAGDVTVTGIVTDPMCAKSGDKAKMSNEDCAKKCSSKDGKLALVNNADGSIWEIENVGAVKGHEGRQVKVSGRANAEKKTFHVTTVLADMGTAPGHHDMKHEEKKK